MATLRIDKAAFDREREVVKEERRMRVENQPYGRLSEIVNGFAFTVHPYRHPTIGSMADLDAASVDDVRDFYRTYYVPSNATVVIAGDIEPARAVELATAYFGRIPPPGRAVPRDIPAEPRRTAPKRLTVEERWPLPVVVVAHHVTFDGHPDSYALHMASKILSDGQSSRIYRKLVYETGIALSAAGIGNLSEHPNLFYAYAVVQPGHTTAEAEQALVQELDRLRAEPVSARELAPREEPVHARLRTGQGDGPAEGRRPRPRVRAAQGRHRIGRRRIRPLPRRHRRRHPARGADVFRPREPHRHHRDPEAGGGRRQVRRVRRTARAAIAAAILVATAPPAAAQVGNWPSEPVPKPLAAKPVAFPPYEVRTLPNGLRVVVVEHHEQPSVSLRMLIGAGTAQDLAPKLGVANMVASLLDQGTATRSAQQIADAVDTIGGNVTIGAGTDVTFAYITVLGDSVAPGLDLLSDIVRSPAFAQEELDRQRDQLRSALRVNYQDPGYLASTVFDRLVYGFHPYGYPAAGTPASIERITRTDLVEFHERYFAPGNCILAVVGDIAAADAFAAVERAFGGWAAREVLRRDDARAARTRAPRGDRGRPGRGADGDPGRPSRHPPRLRRVHRRGSGRPHPRRGRREPAAADPPHAARAHVWRVGRPERATG